jgi:hypothetical protein
MLCLVAALRRRRRRSKSVLTIPERASAAAASLRGRLRANNRRGVGGGDARSTGEEGQHHHNMKLEQYGVKNANGNTIITVGRQGSSSMGRRLRGGSDMQTRNGNLISDLVGNTKHARHLGTTTGKVGPRKGTLSYVYRTAFLAGISLHLPGKIRGTQCYKTP